MLALSCCFDGSIVPAKGVEGSVNRGVIRSQNVKSR